MSDTLQLAIVGLVVALCAWRAVKRYAPKTAWRMQASLAFAFERPGRPAWSLAIGRWLRPADVVAGGGCGSGCTTCGGCATPGSDAIEAMPIQVLPRRTN